MRHARLKLQESSDLLVRNALLFGRRASLFLGCLAARPLRELHLPYQASLQPLFSLDSASSLFGEVCRQAGRRSSLRLYWESL